MLGDNLNWWDLEAVAIDPPVEFFVCVVYSTQQIIKKLKPGGRIERRPV
jgi:hypothetical protein